MEARSLDPFVLFMRGDSKVKRIRCTVLKIVEKDPPVRIYIQHCFSSRVAHWLKVPVPIGAMILQIKYIMEEHH